MGYSFAYYGNCVGPNRNEQPKAPLAFYESDFAQDKRVSAIVQQLIRRGIYVDETGVVQTAEVPRCETYVRTSPPESQLYLSRFQLSEHLPAMDSNLRLSRFEQMRKPNSPNQQQMRSAPSSPNHQQVRS